MTQNSIGSTNVSNVASEIVRYLENRPNAAETVDGIAMWWLARQRFEDSKETVQLALEYLVNQGMLCKQIFGGKEIYRKSELVNGTPVKNIKQETP